MECRSFATGFLKPRFAKLIIIWHSCLQLLKQITFTISNSKSYKPIQSNNPLWQNEFYLSALNVFINRTANIEPSTDIWTETPNSKECLLFVWTINIELYESLCLPAFFLVLLKSIFWGRKHLFGQLTTPKRTNT